MASIVQSLIDASEKAACIARSCVGGSDDALLVAEKSEDEANTRFDKDYKTIADVLAQEAAKMSIVSNYPVLADHVRGEECSEIDGKKIKLLETASETSELLSSLVTLNLAERMAEAAHKIQHVHDCGASDDVPGLDISDIGVWIDPIDATSQFIAGVRGEAKAGEGLECVTVLIGAYLRSTGEPVIGVINQPFYNNGEGRAFWGVSYGNTNKWGGSYLPKEECSNIILMSNAEESKTKSKFAESNYSIDTAPGAGYKLLQVCLGEAEAYLLSKGTTFLWDTCAAHAILKAKGGDIISFQSHEPITYNVPTESKNKVYCNSEGIIAYNNKNISNKIMAILQ